MILKKEIYFKNVFTANIPINIFELPTIDVEATIPLRFGLRDAEKAIAGLNPKRGYGFEKPSNKMIMELLQIESQKSFYTNQLKSGKGLQVVIKGIDSCVDSEEKNWPTKIMDLR